VEADAGKIVSVIGARIVALPFIERGTVKSAAPVKTERDRSVRIIAHPERLSPFFLNAS
jgi:hypothetical protein